ncbi:ankyrin repeat domain-containing protein 26-like [Apodemus sylvaticus]|uniref:ankyrin repeat domain-containing protein 26-like n=1 Tax=Apodemus sylvaticus TaxID=10129 RepID=UPI00224378D1|nr:ankyrin repeat domain-containing protein 26-like [Apodemus sylvaticus]
MPLEHRYKEIELEIVETKSRAISVKAQRRTFEEKYRAKLQLGERLKYELEKSILHYACVYDQPNVVALLIEWNCGIDLRDSDNIASLIKDGFTPCTLSLIKINDNLAKLLEDQKEKINELDELDRSSKKTSNEKGEVKEQGNHMFGLNEETSSSEGNSEDSKVFSCDTVLHLIEQHIRQTKGTQSVILLKIWGIFYSYKRSLEFEKLKFELIEEENERISNDIIVLQEEWSQLEIENVELQDEICSLRSSKKTSNEKEEVKEQGNHMLDLKELISCEGNSNDCEQYSCDTILHFIEELMRQRKDINSEILVKIWGAVYTYKRSIDFEKHKCELIEEDCERISNEIIALREEWSQLEIENAELQDELCSLRATLENLELNDAASLQAEENEELSRTPVQEEQFKLYLSLTQSLHEMRRKNTELEEEIDRYMDLCTMMEEDSDAHQNGEFSGYNTSSTSHCEEDTVLKLREKLESMETKLQQELFRCQCKEDENNLLEQKIAERKAARENREAEEGRIKQLEEKILSLKADMDKNMVERSEVENHKKAIEEQARSQLMEKINQENQVLRELAASEQQKDQEIQDYIMSLEHRYKEIKPEIVETKSGSISVKAQWRTFEEKYRAELQLGERLKYELENIYSSIVELQNTKSRLASERRMNRLSHIHTHHRSVSEGTSDSSLQNIFGFNSTGATI